MITTWINPKKYSALGIPPRTIPSHSEFIRESFPRKISQTGNSSSDDSFQFKFLPVGFPSTKIPPLLSRINPHRGFSPKKKHLRRTLPRNITCFNIYIFHWRRGEGDSEFPTCIVSALKPLFFLYFHFVIVYQLLHD